MERDPTSDLARSGVVVDGRYRLDSVIGRGGMGSVWSATHLGLGHRIAVKLISREFIRSADALRRFDAEAKAAARLQSRHVVQVYDNGTLEDGTPYIAMELLAGESLQHRIEERGRVELRDAVEILAQCCKALGRAHASGIVHRDIKPDNVFLARSPDEDGEVVKILDFGVAKVGLGEGDQAHTGTGMLLGTPLYMSPEQARGLKTLDARADLYSLGLVGYTMLTGRLAIDGESFGDILLKICVEPLPSLRAAAPWLPPAMEAWFQRACAREPADRCQSVQEFIGTLREAAGEGIAFARTAVELPQMATNAAPVVLPTLVTSGGVLGQASSVHLSGVNMAITAAGVPRRNLGVVIAGGALGVLALLAVGVLVAVHPHPREGAEGPADTPSSTASGLPSLAVPNDPVPSAAPSASTSSAPAPRIVVAHPPVAPAAAASSTVRTAPRPTGLVPAPLAPPVTTPRATVAPPVPTVPPSPPPAAPALPPVNLGY
jgi:eukaryotic-like serine/threonine-protein kinase